jgi:hypothetical protein
MIFRAGASRSADMTARKVAGDDVRRLAGEVHQRRRRLIGRDASCIVRLSPFENSVAIHQTATVPVGGRAVTHQDN